jgi:hypothetical protein
MPYPYVHILFFFGVFAAPAIYAAIQMVIKRELHSKEGRIIFLILLLGSFCAMLPDIPFTWNYLLYEKMEYWSIGSMPTHSLLFGTTAFAIAAITGYLYFKDLKKASALGLFGYAAFLSHLLADDLQSGSIVYLYPVQTKPISIFASANVKIANTNFPEFDRAWIIIALFFIAIMILSLFALSQLGFEFKYQK